jgi:hypothetical protein
MGDKCECNFISRDNGFIGVEFLLPNEIDTGVRQTCILCHRRTVQTLFYDLLYTGRPFRGVIQRFGNICSKVGEYSNDVMLICPIGGPVQCMPFPSVSHQRNRYTVVSQGISLPAPFSNVHVCSLDLILLCPMYSFRLTHYPRYYRGSQIHQAT